MASRTILLIAVVNIYLVSYNSCLKLERSHRPSYAGLTGGTWESLIGQKIPPGTPWPAKAEDYTTTSPYQKPDAYTKTEQLITKTTSHEQMVNFSKFTTETYVDNNKTEKDNLNSSTSSTSIILEYKPQRPSFAGLTGGTWENLAGQIIPSGTPWPDKTENYDKKSNSTTTETAPSISNIIPNTTASSLSFNSSVSLEYKPQRPSFAGLTGGTWGNLVGQIIPSGTSWPDKAEDYDKKINSTTTEIAPSIGNIIPNTTASPSSSNSSISLEYKPQRPSFAGLTGGAWGSNTRTNQEENINFTTTTIRYDATSTLSDSTASPYYVKPVQNNITQSIIENQTSTLPPEQEASSSVYLFLSVEDIKSAIKKNPVQHTGNNIKPFVIWLKLDEIGKEVEKRHDDIKASEEFLSAEKCGHLTRNTNVLSILLNVDGLREALRQSQVEINSKDGH